MNADEMIDESAGDWPDMPSVLTAHVRGVLI